MFGEAGPERVDITPLSRNGADVGKVFGDTSAAGGGGATIRIALGEGLEAKIIDNALGTAARLVLTSEG